METQEGGCGPRLSGAHTKRCPERLRVMSFPPEKFLMGGRPTAWFSSSAFCPSNMKLSQFAITYFCQPPGFSHEWAWGWRQGCGGQESGLFLKCIAYHEGPINLYSNLMDMQPTLRRWKKKRDRNVSFSECLSSLSALGTGWGLMPKKCLSQYNAGEWRVAAEDQGPGLSKADHFSSWRLTDSEIQTQVWKGWLNNMLSSSLSWEFCKSLTSL